MRIKRLISIFIDYMICLYISSPILFLDIIKFEYEVIIILILFSIKDLIFKNQSIGKKIMKLEIVNKENEKPNKLILICRNLTLYIWPLEIILLLIFNKRIGDILFNTQVVEIKNNIKQEQSQ